MSRDPPSGDDHGPYLPTKEEVAAFYVSREWRALAYDMKILRGRRCEVDGMGPEHGVAVHADHIKSVKFHWHLRLTETNIQILCEDCNLAKGSRDSRDFRREAVATEGLMAHLREKIGLANMNFGPSLAKEIITDAYSLREISEAQGGELVRHFGLESA